MDDTAIDELEAELADICGHLNVLHARMVDKVAVALRDKAWFQAGIHTPAQWLAWQTGLSMGRAREIVRMAQLKVDEQFPTVFASFEAGTLAVDQVAVATKAPAWTDEQMCGLAEMLTVTQLGKVVRSYRFDDPKPKPAPDPPAEPAESFSGWFDSSGRYHFGGELDPDHGREFDAALRQARDRRFRDAPVEERCTISNVDALMEMVRSSFDGTPLARRDRYRVNLYLDATPGRAPGSPFTWSDGTAIPDWLINLFTCDGTITPILVEDGVPVSVGRTARIVPERTRRLVEHRDRGCRVPGCHRSRHVEVHHIIHDTDGGGCDTFNLISLCPYHHRLHHQGRLGISGNADLADGVTFTDHRGRPLPGSGTPRPPNGPPPPPRQPYRHPIGERLDYDMIYFHEPPAA